MAATIRSLRIGGREFHWGARTYVMGIVNVTPDSFSGDGVTDPQMAATIARAGVAVVLMHNNPGGGYRDLIGEIAAGLRESAELGRAAGIPEDRIIVDPGIGFGKTREENLEIIKRLPDLRRLGFPLLIGPSRKSFIGKTLDLPVGERLEGTAAAIALSIAGGADIVRVHDVKSMVRVARMADAIVHT